MHDIESRRANIPPVPASAVKDQLNDDVWAQQYLEDGRHFNVSYLCAYIFYGIALNLTCSSAPIIILPMFLWLCSCTANKVI